MKQGKALKQAYSVLYNCFGNIARLKKMPPKPKGIHDTMLKSKLPDAGCSTMDQQNDVRILIVDDEPPIVTALEFLLQREGYQVDTAFNGMQALDKMEKNRPDIVMLDVMMPGMDGFEVARRIRNEPSYEQAKMVFLTAKGAADDKRKGYSTGGEYYMVKPFDNDELVQMIHEIALYG